MPISSPKHPQINPKNSLLGREKVFLTILSKRGNNGEEYPLLFIKQSSTIYNIYKEINITSYIYKEIRVCSVTKIKAHFCD
jgi:hypothetical protein